MLIQPLFARALVWGLFTLDTRYVVAVASFALKVREVASWCASALFGERSSYQFPYLKLFSVLIWLRRADRLGNQQRVFEWLTIYVSLQTLANGTGNSALLERMIRLRISLYKSL